MTELMMKMTSWLLVAMALGFIVAWLLSKIIYKSRQGYEEDSFSAVILERNNMITKLEKDFRNEKIMFEKLSGDLKNSEEALAEKTSYLTTLQNKLDNNNTNEHVSLELKEQNTLLLLKVQKLKQLDRARVEELEGFEEIVLLAESKVEENEKSYSQILKKLDEDINILTIENEKYKNTVETYEKNNEVLKSELKLYEADSAESEFIISKDQFVKIEQQLETYQDEIKSLKSKNSELLLKSKTNINGLQPMHRTLEDKTVEKIEKEHDDSSMVKAFRETYKKITNS
jgi:hypothetical protein